MTTSGKTARHLDVHLVANLDLPPDAAPALAPAGIKARVAVSSLPDEAGTHVSLYLAADWTLPVAAVRWLVDQVVRRTRRLFDLGGAGVTLNADGVPTAVRSAIGLDLRRAFGPKRGPNGAGMSLTSLDDERYATSEDLFRSWVNEDPSTRTSLAIARDAEALPTLVEQHDLPGQIEVEVLDEAALSERGLRLLLTVGQASTVSPPRLIIARWEPHSEGASDGPIMLLGKGITFDTGGINVKPYESFVSHMRNDMAGAALVFAAFRHLVLIGYPRPLVMVIPTCENAVGENAMRPGTVVKSHRGLNVKIDHTDAEGRLVLADALSYAEERFAPDTTLCFATLTTAALQAYGPHATPIHFADAAFEQALSRSSLETGEDLHFFPARPWHFEANRDDEADLKNTARLTGYMPAAAGSRNAAHFLLHFARHPLVHADIFASTWNWAGDHPGTGFGATGTPLRTYLRALESIVRG
jgi:leucyl aminopeptidase